MIGPPAFGQDQDQHGHIDQKTNGGDHRREDDRDRKHLVLLAEYGKNGILDGSAKKGLFAV